jgi:hypothetical protein
MWDKPLVLNVFLLLFLFISERRHLHTKAIDIDIDIDLEHILRECAGDLNVSQATFLRLKDVPSGTGLYYFSGNKLIFYV